MHSECAFNTAPGSAGGFEEVISVLLSVLKINMFPAIFTLSLSPSPLSDSTSSILYLERAVSVAWTQEIAPHSLVRTTRCRLLCLDVT